MKHRKQNTVSLKYFLLFIIDYPNFDFPEKYIQIMDVNYENPAHDQRVL